MHIKSNTSTQTLYGRLIPGTLNRLLAYHPVAILNSTHSPFPAVKGDGLVYFRLPHGSKYVVCVRNPFQYERCSFNLEIDGVNMGSFVLKPGGIGYFERPVRVNKCFTFLAESQVERAESAADLLSMCPAAVTCPQVIADLHAAPLNTGIESHREANGRIRCTFTPEMQRVKYEPRPGDLIINTPAGMFRIHKRIGSGGMETTGMRDLRSVDDMGYSSAPHGEPSVSASLKKKCSRARPASAATGGRGKNCDSSVSSSRSRSSSSVGVRSSALQSSVFKPLAHASLLSYPPGSAGASTLQGTSGQYFRGTRLEKDRSRAVEFTVWLVVHDSPLPTPRQGPARQPRQQVDVFTPALPLEAANPDGLGVADVPVFVDGEGRVFYRR
jgi:hypothetical protein